MTELEKAAEVKCGTTHYEGCACHEAKRNQELELLRRVAEAADGAAGPGPDGTFPLDKALEAWRASQGSGE